MAGPVLGRRRSALEIMHEMLSARDNGGAGKTAIMYQSSLSHSQLQRYLSLLSGQDLIQMNGEGKYKMTAAGRKTLGQMSSVMRSFSAY
jgi:predicted transcriptional regulator